MKNLSAKTLKREMAWAMFFHIVYLSVWGDSSLLELLIWPYVVFIGGAFSLESFKKDGFPNISVNTSDGMFSTRRS